MPHTVKIYSEAFWNYIAEKIVIFRYILKISIVYIAICLRKLQGIL